MCGLGASIENFGMFRAHCFVRFGWLVGLVHLSFSVSRGFDRGGVRVTRGRWEEVVGCRMGVSLRVVVVRGLFGR